MIRKQYTSTITLETKPTKTFDPNGVYKIYGSYTKKLAEMPSYAYLAVARAEEEKQISLGLQRPLPALLRSAETLFVPRNPSEIVSYLSDALTDGLKRLFLPSLEREFRSEKKRRADEAAI
ncbi:RNA-binding transcriptional accessory protein, partial [Patescibacteria group bacterium]|nr:RNA-binding transcriptional accessory protein [Patescibacteria group bacterium]